MNDKMLNTMIDMYNVIMDSKEEFDKATAIQQLGEVAKTINCYGAMMELNG